MRGEEERMRLRNLRWLSHAERFNWGGFGTWLGNRTPERVAQGVPKP